MNLPSASTQAASLPDWDHMRRTLDWNRRPLQARDKALLGSTLYWLDALPRGVRPLQLPIRFARIANELCRLWLRPADFDFCLWDLRTDRRGDRDGFPPLVAEELRALHAYAERQHFVFVEGGAMH